MNDLGVPFVKFSLGIWDQGIKSEEACAVFSYREKDFLEGWLVFSFFLREKTAGTHPQTQNYGFSEVGKEFQGH